ncbi:MAG: nucleoside hydrolase, partial [Rubrobacter sp.]
MMDPTRVVLDCDTANEVDDQFAIAHALGVPTLEVRGVVSVHNTTAHGPGSRDMYQEEAERVVALCGGGAPCVPGAERPMEGREELVPSAGLEFLVEEARLGPLTIIATGPATDVASLLLAAPESRDNVRVVWLGGFGDESSYRSWQNRMGELNGRADVSAWRVLFEGTLDLLHVPTWPAAAKILVEPFPFAEELRSLERPVASYLAEILQLWTSEYGDPPKGDK